MPVSEYYKGSGSRVMKSMAKRYGAKRGKAIFYATANARGMAPKRSKKRSSKR